MAEVTGLRNNALPYPVYGAPWGVAFPILDADGDLVTGATTPDAEVSKNGDTFADCTNESTEIATSSGVYYLLLTATEMTSDVVTVIAKSATAGAKTTVLTFYPRKLVTIRSGTSDSGGVSTSTIVLDASASAVDDFYNGMVCIATIDGNVEARVISDYTGSSKTATVSPDWNVAPDNTDAFVIKLPEGAQLNQANVTVWNGTVVSTPATAGIPDVNVKNIDNDAASASGTVTFPNATLASTTNITAGTITTATNVTTVNGLAANVITAASMAADASAEIADAVWDEAQADHVGAGSFGLTASEIADILVDTAEIGAAGAGLTNINLPNQTMDIVGNITGNLSGSVGSVTGSVGGNVTGSVGSLAAQAKADVNAEVVDALATDTYAEPGQGTPGATISLSAKIGYLYKAWRNRSTMTASEYALYGDDAVTKDQEATFSDNGTTADRGEVATGA